VENHGRFTIPDGLGRRIIPAPELRKREVIAGIHKSCKVPEDLKPVLTGLFVRDSFFIEVVGEVGCEALAPVPMAVVDQNAVAPPAVSDLVPQTGLYNERESDDRASKERVGRKSVTGGKKFSTIEKLLKRVGPNQFLIERKVPTCCIEVIVGKRCAFRKEVGRDRDALEVLFPNRVGAGRHRQTF